MELSDTAKSVWRHYYKSAKKELRKNGGRLLYTYDHYLPGKGNPKLPQAPLVWRGTKKPEIEQLHTAGKFSSNWAIGSKKRTFVASSPRKAWLYAKEKPDSRIYGMTPSVLRRADQRVADQVGATTTNAPLRHGILKNEVRVLLKPERGRSELHPIWKPTPLGDIQKREFSEGLWSNIRAKRERIKRQKADGKQVERMRKPGSKGAPTAQSLKDSQSRELTDLLKGMKEFDKPFLGYNASRHAKTGGLNDSFRKKYNSEHGSNLKRPVTKKPSELKPGSKDANRRASFCARMKGCAGPTSKDGKLTPKGAALKRWNCSALLERVKEFQSYAKTPEEERHDLIKTGMLSTGIAAGAGLAGLALRGTVGKAERADIAKNVIGRIRATRDRYAAGRAAARVDHLKKRDKEIGAFVSNFKKSKEVSKGEKASVSQAHTDWRAKHPDVFPAKKKVKPVQFDTIVHQNVRQKRDGLSKARDAAQLAGGLGVLGLAGYAGYRTHGIYKSAKALLPTEIPKVSKAIRATLASVRKASNKVSKTSDSINKVATKVESGEVKVKHKLFEERKHSSLPAAAAALGAGAVLGAAVIPGVRRIEKVIKKSARSVKSVADKAGTTQDSLRHSTHIYSDLGKMYREAKGGLYNILHPVNTIREAKAAYRAGRAGKTHYATRPRPQWAMSDKSVVREFASTFKVGDKVFHGYKKGWNIGVSGILEKINHDGSVIIRSEHPQPPIIPGGVSSGHRQWKGHVDHLSLIGLSAKFFGLQTEEDGIPYSGRVAKDRFIKKIHEDDLDRRDANILRAGLAGSAAGVLSPFKGASIKKALIGAGLAGAGVLAVRAATSHDRDIYGERPRWAKRSESLPAIAAIGAGGAFMAKKAKMFSELFRHHEEKARLKKRKRPIQATPFPPPSVPRVATEADWDHGLSVIRNVISQTRKNLSAKEFSSDKKHLNPYVSAALSGGISTAIGAGAIPLLRRGGTLKTALKTAGLAGAFGASVGGGGAYLGSKIIGHPRKDEGAPFTKRAAIGGALIGAGVGAAAGLAAKKLPYVSKAIGQVASEWRPAHWIAKASTPASLAIGTGVGAAIGGHEGAGEGERADVINSLHKDIRKNFAAIDPVSDARRDAFGASSVLGGVAAAAVGAVGYRMGAKKTAERAASFTKRHVKYARQQRDTARGAASSFKKESERYRASAKMWRDKADAYKRSSAGSSTGSARSNQSGPPPRSRAKGEHNPYAGTDKAEKYEKFQAMNRMAREGSTEHERAAAAEGVRKWKTKYGFSRAIRQLREFGYSNQPRYEGVQTKGANGKTYWSKDRGRFADPIRAGFGVGGKLMKNEDGTTPDFSQVQIARGFYNKGKDVHRWGGRAGGLASDVGDVMAGNPRRRDASGRPQRREWEKSWFKNAVGAAGVGAGLLGAGYLTRNTQYGRRNIQPLLHKAINWGNKHGIHVMSSKLEAKYFDQWAEMNGWDVRDPRGRSARVFAPGARARYRRDKEWHEKKENRDKLWMGAALGAAALGVAGGYAGTRVGMGRPVIPNSVKNAFRPKHSSGPTVTQEYWRQAGVHVNGRSKK
jgi:hypothetical protein